MRMVCLAVALSIVAAALASPAAAVVYVKWDSPGPTFDGTSWDTAFHTIQQGIDTADAANEEVWVAQGTYLERITLKDGVMVHGGYAGSGTARNPATYVTTIDGSGSTTQPAVTGANSSGVDGFTITRAIVGIIASSKTGLVIANNTISANTLQGIGLSQCTSPVVSNNVFTNNGQEAAIVSATGRLTFGGNTGSGNKTNGLVLSRCQVNQDSQWRAAPDFPYVIFQTLYISSTLTIDPGVVIKLRDGVIAAGQIQACGTADSPIYFTSYEDDSVGGDTDGNGSQTPIGYWWGITVSGTGSSAQFEHCVMRYGGGASSMLTGNTGQISLADCEVSHSSTAGISYSTSVPGGINVTG